MPTPPRPSVAVSATLAAIILSQFRDPFGNKPAKYNPAKTTAVEPKTATKAHQNRLRRIVARPRNSSLGVFSSENQRPPNRKNSPGDRRYRITKQQNFYRLNHG